MNCISSFHLYLIFIFICILDTDIHFPFLHFTRFKPIHIKRHYCNRNSINHNSWSDTLIKLQFGSNLHTRPWRRTDFHCRHSLYRRIERTASSWLSSTICVFSYCSFPYRLPGGRRICDVLTHLRSNCTLRKHSGLARGIS